MKPALCCALVLCLISAARADTCDDAATFMRQFGPVQDTCDPVGPCASCADVMKVSAALTMAHEDTNQCRTTLASCVLDRDVATSAALSASQSLAQCNSNLSNTTYDRDYWKRKFKELQKKTR